MPYSTPKAQLITSGITTTKLQSHTKLLRCILWGEKKKKKNERRKDPFHDIEAQVKHEFARQCFSSFLS